MRFSAFQLIAFSTAISAMFAFLFLDSNDSLTWRSDSLTYQRPATPRNFREAFGLTDGSELFFDSHSQGWKACRYHFYLGHPCIHSTRLEMSQLRTAKLKTEDGASAAAIAYAVGYRQCESQIDELLLKHQPHALRQQLVIPKSPYRIPFLVLSLFSAACLVIARIPRQNTGTIQPQT